MDMDHKQLVTIFARLGFKKNAGLIYESLRQNGPLVASHIARASKIHRPAVYQTLHALLNTKLISVKKVGKRNYYTAVDERRLIPLFIKNLENIVKNIPERKSSGTGADSGIIRIFQGAKEIGAVFDEVIEHTKRGDTFYRYTSERDLEAVNRYLSPNYRKHRDNKRLERLVISNPVSGRQKRPRLERFIKFIPPEASLFDQNIIQIIYANRVAFIDLNIEQAIIIENAALADFQKVIFKQLYRKL